MDEKEPFFELENNMYLFLDKTVISTFHIMNLYNHLQEDDQPKALYANFLSTQMPDVMPLIENDIVTMQEHFGQMNGEYPLSPSQREAVNHFDAIEHGEILAVNGPPGTGKTTLLQTIVADMYVKKAINKERAPLIIASSTNNQAVTNIISSFGNIKKMGISNLEERWIEGVNSFATYFPSASKVKEARSKGYQYTNQKGEFFVSDIEAKDNIEKSKVKLIASCNEYFEREFNSILACQEKLHEELLFIERSKVALPSLAQEASQCDLDGETLDKRLEKLLIEIEEKQTVSSNILQRITDWQSCYKKIPFYVKWLKFIKRFARKIQTEFRLFMNDEEQSFLNEYLTYDEIKGKYSQLYAECNKAIADLKRKKSGIEKIKSRYDSELEQLHQHKINLHGEKDERYQLDLDYINDLLDKKHRYVAFWLAIHYYECRWVSGEDELSEKQKGTNFVNVLDKFYNRLSMITPCLVMTFYMLPRQFLAYGEQKSFFLYDYIDLLIVDEAGQVSPEIAAGAFSLDVLMIRQTKKFDVRGIKMIADIKGKISRSGSNLTERLEDNMTGNVFGALRYMPFSTVMGEILIKAVYPKSIGEDIRDIQYEFWADKIQFWPYDREGEIDALIEFEDMIIGIEVKYTSGLSSDDDISNNEDNEVKNQEEKKKSINQLARESRIVLQKGSNKKKILLFVADRNSCKEVYADILTRNIIDSNVAFGYISWQDFLFQLKRLNVTDPYHHVIINDVIALLIRKGFEDFTNMLIEVPQPIDDEQYFQFNVENEGEISFQTELSINGGLNYEFS